MEKRSSLMDKEVPCAKTARGKPADTEVKSSTVCGTDHDHYNTDDIVGENLEKYDWDELAAKFAEAMKKHCQAEELLHKETRQLLETFIAWSQVMTSRDEERSFKRFKTRVQHVQNSELRLSEKRKHYSNVVKAFETAMALLK